ncbi:hypothetical protein C8R44DRAFT_889482 [Mycena epipterygia]|nr:hypothetical protein C8R44DRAFT_889482 [Mycena epipterygia]
MRGLPIAAVDLAADIRRRISVEFLDLDNQNIFQWWLDDHRCPFDFSALKTARFVADAALFRARNLAPALKSIEVIQISSWKDDIDLSAFEALVDVEMPMDNSSQPIHAQSHPDDSIFHARVFVLPNLCSVHISMDGDIPAMPGGADKRSQFATVECVFMLLFIGIAQTRRPP